MRAAFGGNICSRCLRLSGFNMVTAEQPRFCSASAMLSEARVGWFYSIMRKRSISPGPSGADQTQPHPALDSGQDRPSIYETLF